MASSAKDIQLRELKDTISQLNTIMSEQTELIRSLRTIIEEKTAHEMVLQEQVDYLTKKLFGSSSEKTPADIPGQLNLFNEAEVYQDPELPEEDCSREPRPRKKKATHAELFKGLKVHKEVIPLDEEDKVCPVCGSPMERIGEEYVRRELVFTPAKCEVYEYYTESYGCPDCKEGKGGKVCDRQIQSTARTYWQGSGFFFHGCMDNLSEVCKRHASLSSGKGLERVWCRCQQDNPCELDHLQCWALFPATV